MQYTIERRRTIEVNTDPQRRCYNGCHFSSALQKTAWSEFETDIAADKVNRRLDFWRELNDIAVEGRGEGARCEFRAVEQTTQPTV